MLPTSASTRRSCTSSPNRARTSRPIESSSMDVRGRNGSSAARALPRQESNPVRASGARWPGTPSRRPSGIRCNASYQTAACTGSGDTSSSARPTSAASSVASGTRARKASAPLSIMSSPAKAVPPIRPPGRSAVSNTVTSSGVALANSHAAARPVIPPPITATRPCFIDRPSLIRRPRSPGRRARPSRRGRR